MTRLSRGSAASACVVAVALLLATLSAQSTAQSDRQFQAALQKETVDGNLKGAIEDYRAIAARPGVSRELAAEALLRMAGAYQKLGDPQARTVYSRVVNEFPELRRIVETARKNLTALDSSAARTNLSLKRVTVPDVYVIAVSPDARWAVFSEFNSPPNAVTGADLVLLDLRSGARRVLDKHPGTGAYAENDAAFSPDGKRIAYHVSAIDGDNDQIRILPVDGSATPRVVYDSRKSNSDYVSIKGWTPDGRRLLISPLLEDGTWQLTMLSLADGSQQTIKSFSWPQVHAALSPDGRYIAYAIPVRDDDVTRDVFILATDGSHETPLVQHPAHDSDPVWSADGTHVLFRSNRTRRSSLWAVPVRNGRPAGEAFLVKDDVPVSRPLGPQQAVTVTKSGALYYSVSQPQLNVYHVALGSDGKAAAPPRIFTSHATNDDCCAAVSPDGKKLAYYSRSPKVLVVRDLTTGSEQEFALNFEINFLVSVGPQWFPDGRSVMAHGSAPQRRGNRQYRVDLTSGRAELLPTSGVSAHSVLAPDGQGILAGVDGLRWHDVRSGEVTTSRPSENNAFLSPSVSPDGKTIAYWNARTEATRVLEIAAVNGSDVRVVCECPFPGTSSPLNVLAWMPDQRHLVYADPVGTLWRVPTEGGAREPLGVSVPPRVQALSVQPDGRGLYFTARQESNPPELWVLENYLPRKASK